jgi:hypothetical protein
VRLRLETNHRRVPSDINGEYPQQSQARRGGGGGGGMVRLMGGESPGYRGVERYVRNDLFACMRLG